MPPLRDPPRQEGVVRAPAPPLRPFIDRYFGYRMTGCPPGTHRGLPSRHMTFIVSIGPSIDVIRQTDPKQAPQAYRCVLSGLQASSALIEHTGNQEGVAIELTPLGSRTLFGVPASALWDLSLELSDVARAAGAELWERLQTTVGWDARFTVCDGVLTRLARPADVAPELRHSWSALVASGGRIPVAELAARTGFSRQHLGRRFRAEFGLGPKLAARVVRFERARRMLLAPGVPSAQVAAAAGYFDQAHLCRDFAELAGCTPTELLSEEVPIVQETEPFDRA